MQLHVCDMHSREAVCRSVNDSLANFHTDYIDLYLVHFPGAEHLDPSDSRNAECRRLVWEELEQFYKYHTVEEKRNVLKIYKSISLKLIKNVKSISEKLII